MTFCPWIQQDIVREKCGRINELISSNTPEILDREYCHLTHIAATRLKAFITVTGLFIIVAGSIVIFAFSTQVLVPAQPATRGYYDSVNGRMVWHAGQPSQPEHFETSYPNFPPGLALILVGLAISATSLLLHKRGEYEDALLNAA